MHYHRSAQSEALKNNDTVKLLNHAQNTLRVRIKELEEGKKEIAALNNEN